MPVGWLRSLSLRIAAVTASAGIAAALVVCFGWCAFAGAFPCPAACGAALRKSQKSKVAFVFAASRAADAATLPATPAADAAVSLVTLTILTFGLVS